MSLQSFGAPIVCQAQHLCCRAKGALLKPIVHACPADLQIGDPCQSRAGAGRHSRLPPERAAWTIGSPAGAFCRFAKLELLLACIAVIKAQQLEAPSSPAAVEPSTTRMISVIPTSQMPILCLWTSCSLLKAADVCCFPTIPLSPVEFFLR